jgi:hypothetical protein
MELKNIHVVEYSVSQGCYHLDTLDAIIMKNTMNVMDERSIDYVPIGFFKSYDEADNFIKWHREKTEILKSAKKMVVNKIGNLIYVQRPRV